MINIFAVVGYKGGTGKTIASTQILPSIILEKDDKADIRYIEIDDNNKTSKVFTASKTFTSMQSITVESSLEELQDLVFDLVVGDGDKTIIIDAGGGNDTQKVMEHIRDLELGELATLTYIVPVKSDLAQADNIRNMHNEKLFGNNKVIYMLNEVINIEQDKLENQFLGFFGNKKLKIPSLFIELDKPKYIAIPHTNIFDISTIKGMTIWDYARFSKNFTFAEYTIAIKKESQDKEFFMEKIVMYEWSRRMKEYAETYLAKVEL